MDRTLDHANPGSTVDELSSADLSAHHSRRSAEGLFQSRWRSSTSGISNRTWTASRRRKAKKLRTRDGTNGESRLAATNTLQPEIHMGTKQEKVMVGVFHNNTDARHAIEALRDAQFSDKKIGLLSHDKDGDPEVKSFKDLEGNKAGKGAAVGAAAGAGGGALWALGIAAGILPAIGPVIAGGILMAIAASAASGAAAGVLVGALTGLGISDEESAYYDDEFKKGRTIVVVQTDDRSADAYRILTSNNSQNLHMVAPQTLTGRAPGPRL